jgi:Fur family transcriptional regulator, ferric uptake regulator
MTKANQRSKDYETHLRAAGVRMTKQRLAIIRVLADTDTHPDANEIFHLAFAADPSISLSTVYRTMRILEERGAIQRHAFDDGRARFEHADSAHHDHLIDIETGKVIEFRSEKIERLQAEIAAELGYDLVRHRLELYGRPAQKSGTARPSKRRAS